MEAYRPGDLIELIHLRKIKNIKLNRKLRSFYRIFEIIPNEGEPESFVLVKVNGRGYKLDLNNKNYRIKKIGWFREFFGDFNIPFAPKDHTLFGKGSSRKLEIELLK